MPAIAANLTQEQAWISYTKLLRLLKTCDARKAHFESFLCIAETVLNTHAIAESESEDYCVPDGEEDVLETIKDLLLVPAFLFDDSFFTQAFNPARILHEVAILYGAHLVDVTWTESISLEDRERNDKRIMTIVWLYFQLYLTAEETCTLQH